MSSSLRSWCARWFRSMAASSRRPRPAPRYRPAVECLEPRLAPATFTVNTTADTNVAFGITAGKLDLGGVQSGASSGDLRWALSQANMTAGPDDIVFSVPANSTIALNQLLMIYDDVTIHGSTAVGLTLSGQNLHRVLYVNNGIVNIEGLAVANGLAKGGDGGNGDFAGGGGGAGLGGGLLINSGTVTLSAVTFADNQALGGNGGDYGGGRVSGFGGGGGAGGAGGGWLTVSRGGVGGGGGGFLGNGGAPWVSSGGGGGGFTGPGGPGGDKDQPGGNGTAIGGGGGGGEAFRGVGGGSGNSGGGDGGTGNFTGGGGGGGGGGGSTGFPLSSSGTPGAAYGTHLTGGNGGFGGGAGGYWDSSNGVTGGTAGDYGGGGGGPNGGVGGFGGGGGGQGTGGLGADGGGGFGGGGGGGVTGNASGGPFGGQGGGDGGIVGGGGGGGGGAGLGGALFIRAGVLTLVDTTFTGNTATGGATGAGGTGAQGGQAKGGALFIMAGASARSLSATPTFGGNSATNAGTTLTNPQDNNNVFGTLLVDTGVTLTATGGTPQSTVVNTAFAQSLQATLLDGAGNPVALVAVTFSAPGSGASATFGGGSVAVTDVNGIASVPATANGMGGSYTVTAIGAGKSASFSLTNNSVIFGTLSPAAWTAGVAYSGTIPISGGTTPYTLVSTTLPAGYSANLSGSTITLTNANPTAATVNFTVTIQDGTGGSFTSGTRTLTINAAPTIGTLTPAAWTAGVAYSGTIGISNGTGPFTLVSTTLPAGYNANLSGSTITVTNANPSAATVNFTVTIRDASGSSFTSGSKTLTVNAAPSFGTLTPAAWTAGVAYSGTISISGGTGAYSSLTTTLPAGYSANLTGNTITVTNPNPTAAPVSFTVSLKDACGGTFTSGTETLTVNAAPTLGALAPTAWTVNQPGYSGAIAISGGTGPFTVSAQSGLPAGLTALISGTSVTFSGTPTSAGTFNNAQLTVQDVVGATISGCFTITINPAVTLGPPSVTQGTAGQPFSSTIAVSGGTGPYSQVTVTGLPTGLTAALSGHTITISGTPTMGGTFPLSVSVQDSVGAVGSSSPSLTIDQPPVHYLATGTGVGSGPEVKVYDAQTGALRFDFLAYDARFRGGVRVAVSDVNGDGVTDIITVPGLGGGPLVQVFSGKDLSLILSFNAYDTGLTTGLYVAAGDVNHDGAADIITAPDAGGGPLVNVFDGKTGAIRLSFNAYDAAFFGGVRVAAGDTNGDGFADIVTGPGVDGGPLVQVFSGQNGSLLLGFNAYDPAFRGGIFVAAGDMDGDGRADILTTPELGGGPLVQVFNGADGNLRNAFNAFPPVSAPLSLLGFFGVPQNGLRVASVDVNGDGRADIIVGQGPGRAPEVKVFDAVSLGVLDDFFAYDPSYLDSIFIGAGR